MGSSNSFMQNGEVDEANNKYLNPPKPTSIPKHNSKDSFNPTEAEFSIVSSGAFFTARNKLRETSAKPHPRYWRQRGTRPYRPLSVKESIEVMVNDYCTTKHPNGLKRTQEERKSLFLDSIDTCTGIILNEEENKGKIMPICSEIILLESYDSIHNLTYEDLDGVEVDFHNEVTFDYDSALNHPTLNEIYRM